jgi:hypothetical protein
MWLCTLVREVEEEEEDARRPPRGHLVGAAKAVDMPATRERGRQRQIPANRGHSAAPPYSWCASGQVRRHGCYSHEDEVACCLLLVAEDDDRKFLTTMGALGGTIAVSLACIRASATTRLRFLVQTRWPAVCCS